MKLLEGEPVRLTNGRQAEQSGGGGGSPGKVTLLKVKRQQVEVLVAASVGVSVRDT